MRYAVSLLDLNAAWQSPAGAVLVETAVEDREREDAVVVTVRGEDAIVLDGERDRIEALADGLAGTPLPGPGDRKVRVFAEGPYGWFAIPAPAPVSRRARRRRGVSRQGARVARRGAIPGAVAPVGQGGVPAATGGHGAGDGADDGFTASGASLADGEAVTPGGGGGLCSSSPPVPGAGRRAHGRETREGGVSPAGAVGSACSHPADARGSDPYAAGRILCLACGESWEARS